MTILKLFICDGCDERRQEKFDKYLPDGWKNVVCSWQGLDGHPTHCADGQWAAELCPACARTAKDRIGSPRAWARLERASPDA